MTKARFVKLVHAQAGRKLSRKAVTQLAEAIFREMKRALIANGRFSYPGVGTWVVRSRSARRGFNPHTREPITVEAMKVIVFRPAPVLRKRLASLR